MSANPRSLALLEPALAQTPALARELLNALQDELDAKPQHFALRDTWRKARSGFAASFEGHLTALLQEASRGGDPLQRGVAGLDSLSLVDERQALQDVAVAHVVHAIEDLSKPELHQLGNFFAALRGTARARERDNPLRPALYAQALHLALAEAALPAQAHHDVMRLAAVPLARALQQRYSQACALLRDDNLTEMVSSHGLAHQDSMAHQRLAAARGVGTHTAQGTFAGLASRVDALNSGPQSLTVQPGPSHAAPAPFIKATGPDMLSRLYDQILADPHLLPPLKGLLARLQVAVVRMARTDASLLRRQDHPTWALLNAVAAYGMGFERADDPRLQAFLHFMEAELQLLIDTPAPTAVLFQQSLGRVEAEVNREARQAGASDVHALEALQRAEQRGDWRVLVREQIDHQIADAPLAPRVHRFLQTAWVEVIVESMVQHGRDSREAQATIDTVDALLDSLQTLRDRAGADGLRMRLPALIKRLQAGCDAIQLPEVKRAPVFAELMAQHGRVLRGLPALERMPVPAPSPAAAPPSADDIVRRLVDERESQMPSQWLKTEVDRGGLPTVPVALYTEHDSPAARAALQAWVDGLQIGHWYHLFVQGDWRTAQIAWISESGQTLLFVGRDAADRHSLTRRALEALLANGLIAALEEDNLVQRAVDTLMSDLEDR